MANNPVAGVEPWGGRSRAVIVDHTGPTSYTQGGETLGQSAFGGPNVLGLAGFYKVDGGLTNSGNYRVDTIYSGTGVRSSVNLKWSYTGNTISPGVSGVVVVLGTTPTNGTYTITATAGVGQIQVVVAAGALASVKLLNPGVYSAAPTFTPPAGLGTGATITAQIGGDVDGVEVAAGTNLSGESIRLLAIGG